MTVGRCQRKGRAQKPLNATTWNSALVPPNALAGLGPPGPCPSDGAPVIFRHLTRLALCPAHCLARIVARWITTPSLQFASWVSPRTSPHRPKGRALAGPGRPVEPGWHLALAFSLKSCQSPGRSAAQKSQSVPVTKLPPPSFSPVSFPSSHRPFPSPPVLPPTT